MTNASEQLVRLHAGLPEDVRERWSIEQVQTMCQTVFPGLTVAEVSMCLNIAGKYDLDPLLREIWGAKGKSKDGSPGKLLIMVGRDGLLRNARRQDGWLGFDADVICAKDVFRVKRSAQGREIIHEYEGVPGSESRGPIIGAWAQVYVQGKHDSYFLASAAEYKPVSPRPGSSWLSNPSAMMHKCALSMALRLAFNLSGVYAEEEMERVIEDMEGPTQTPEQSLALAMAQVPEDLRDRLYAAYGEAAELRPHMLTPAAIQMSVSGQPRERVEEFVLRVEDENRRAREAREDAIPEVDLDTESLPDDAQGQWVQERQRTLSDLYDERTMVEEAESHGDADAEIARLDREIDVVESQLRAAGVEPFQGTPDART